MPANEFPCRRPGCQEVFGDASSLKAHNRIYHQQETTLTYSNGEKIPVTRQSDGQFTNIPAQSEGPSTPHTQSSKVPSSTPIPPPIQSSTPRDPTVPGGGEVGLRPVDSRLSTVTVREPERPNTPNPPQTSQSEPGSSQSVIFLGESELVVSGDPDVIENPFNLDINLMQKLKLMNVTVHPELIALVCLECRYCLDPIHLDSHLKTKHHRKPLPKEINEIVEALRPLHLLSKEQLLARQKTLKLIGPVEPFRYLLVSPGFKCSECGELRGQPETIRYHTRQCRSGYESVHIQYLTAGTGKTYFQVNPPPQTRDTSPQDLREEQEILMGASEYSDAALSSTDTPILPWLERTKWLEYGPVELLDSVVHLSSPLKESEPHYDILKTIELAVKHIWAIGLQRIDDTDILTLRRFRSPSDTMSSRPFSRKQEESTHQDYLSVLVRLVLFAFRLHLLPDTLEKTRVVLSPQVHNQLSVGKQQAGQGDPCKPELVTAISHLLAELWKSELALANRFTNPVINFMALLGYDTEKRSFRPPELYTRYLAALTFGTRLSSLFICWHAYEEELKCQKTQEEAEEVFRQNADNAIEFLKDSCPHPPGEILSLHAMGKALSKNTYVAGKIIWNAHTDYTSLDFKGERFDITLFQKLIQHIFKEMEKEACFLLFCDTPDQLPKLPERVFDMPGNLTSGWSFAKDPRNKEIPEFAKLVLKKIFGNPELKQKYFRSRGVLIHVAAEIYLKHASRFLDLLAMAIHMTTGQPPRGPELLTLRLCNVLNGIRNFYIIDDQEVMILTSYIKSQAMTGFNKASALNRPPPILLTNPLFHA
ncbi:hypothetical protein ABW19_dt0202223 [Dactylella cylindrospora]|nr:hypothetical protein ABW19_dt0202223 [Dactylella cylindrospora]